MEQESPVRADSQSSGLRSTAQEVQNSKQEADSKGKSTGKKVWLVRTSFQLKTKSYYSRERTWQTCINSASTAIARALREAAKDKAVKGKQVAHWRATAEFAGKSDNAPAIKEVNG